MRQLMLEDARKLGVHHLHPIDRQPELAIKQSAGPRRRLGHVKELLVSVEDHENALARRKIQSADEIVEIGLQCLQDLPPQFRRRLSAFETQFEMAGGFLSESGLSL